MTTTATARPLTVVPAVKDPHPDWCSPKRCRTTDHAVIHESEPVNIDGLNVSAHHPVAPNAVTYPTVCIETGTHDDDQFVQLHLNQAPALAHALLDLFR